MDMSMPMMAMTDQGQPVNHHLEVHLYDAATGEPIMDQVPTITITDQATGEARTLSSVVPMYGIEEGMSDWHYGNNVYLPDGLYTLTVGVAGQSIVFRDIAATSGTVMDEPMMPDMPEMSP
jgi:hypothetical protein